MHLHVTDQDIRINKQGSHLRLTREGDCLGDILINDIETAAFYGTARPSIEALLAMLDSGTDITFLSKNGRYKGRMVSSLGKNVNLRLAQYQTFCDTGKRYSISQKLTLNKVRNGYALLDFYDKNPHSNFKFNERKHYSAAIKAIENYPGTNLDKLRGFEGVCAKIYFGAFARCLNSADNLGFAGRQYHPCKDPVNSLLSLGYAFVSREIESQLISYGFDPMLGLLHQPEYGRASLALDVMEEFRHPLVDRLVLKLFNHKIITADDFEHGSNDQLQLKKDSFSTFIRNYEQACNTPNRLCKEAQGLTWRSLMRERIESLRRTILESQNLTTFNLDFNLLESAA